MEITAFHRLLCPVVRHQTDDSSHEASDRGVDGVVFAPPDLPYASRICSARYHSTMLDSALPARSPRPAPHR
ncbi:hypothetical protein [Streptomyces sp. CAS3]